MTWNVWSGRGPGSRAARLLALALLPVLAACPPEEQRTDAVDQEEVARALSPEARIRLDSANAAYRAGSYDSALALFREVVELAPEDPVGWFGVYMAQTALGEVEAAEEALAQARARAPGASLIRDPVPPSP